jgi:HEPN domain-containing protein
MTRRDFQALSATRLREARALLKTGNPEGAYYLAGYAIECALKACVAKKTRGMNSRIWNVRRQVTPISLRHS